MVDTCVPAEIFVMGGGQAQKGPPQGPKKAPT